MLPLPFIRSYSNSMRRNRNVSFRPSLHSQWAFARPRGPARNLAFDQAPGLNSGFTLVEVLLALALLAVSLLSLAMLFPMLTRLAAQSRLSSQTVKYAQRELDQVRANIFNPSGAFTDQDGNTVDVSCPGGPGSACGNTLTATGEIDFSTPPPVGYSAQLTDSSGQTFQVRWNISVTANGSRKIILACRPVNPRGGIARTVQLQTLVAK